MARTPFQKLMACAVRVGLHGTRVTEEELERLEHRLVEVQKQPPDASDNDRRILLLAIDALFATGVTPAACQLLVAAVEIAARAEARAGSDLGGIHDGPPYWWQEGQYA